ncbi:MAG: SRPBCC family protein [Pseudobdellovibrionaceae bacterium]
MEQTSRTINKNKSAETSIGNTPLVEVTRNFIAPIDRVWQAWSEPEFAKQWWGPEEFTCPEARIDFREGGKYLFAMKDTAENLVWSGGVYEHIILNEKIVCSDNFTDQDGNVVSPHVYNMAGDWPETLRITVEFEQYGDEEIRMSLRHEGIPSEMHDSCVKGWDSSFNKLQRLVERLVRTQIFG